MTDSEAIAIAASRGFSHSAIDALVAYRNGATINDVSSQCTVLWNQARTWRSQFLSLNLIGLADEYKQSLTSDVGARCAAPIGEKPSKRPRKADYSQPIGLTLEQIARFEKRLSKGEARVYELIARRGPITNAEIQNAIRPGLTKCKGGPGGQLSTLRLLDLVRSSEHGQITTRSLIERGEM